MFDTLFGTSASICTDATPLAATCSCTRQQRQGPRSIDCAGRGLDNLPVGLTLPGGFSAVTFGENKLTEVKRGQFRFNRLRVLDPSLFVNTDIRVLLLSHNPLVKLDPMLFMFVPRLRRLDLSSMRSLRRLEAHAFSGLDQLEELRCGSGGALAEVHPAAFRDAASGEHLARLVSVDLAGNNLTGVSCDLLPWGRMEFVGVEQNPWTCDCDMAWAAGGALPHEDAPSFVCEKPRAAVGRPVSSLTAAEFGCQDGFVASTGFVAGIALSAVAVAVVVAVVTVFQIKFQHGVKRKTGGQRRSTPGGETLRS
ncbi:leucine-rich repeat-containing protein 4-like [Pollicipes pollicipes]|uniref:leucine-rich repeat-containing protein 4-like n=1 Tax=Pollicipes pollicipes TaxID=41117 RepID=UPI0018858CFC|nr:leucine-rich repeat-containing protein 4-like [Pollicipes pollicipes]